MKTASRIHWSSLAFGALLSFGVAGTATAQDSCTPKHEGLQTLEQGFIIPAVTILVPFSFMDANGKASGIDGDILAEIAKMECLEIKPQTVDTAAAIQSVISKRADTTVGAWYRTEKRAEVVNLSAPLYVDQMSVWSKAGIDTMTGLEGKTVGTVQGNLWVTDVAAILGDSLMLYPNSVGMQQDLMSGRIDAGLEGMGAAIAAMSAGGMEGMQIKPIQPDDRVGASQAAGQITFPLAKGNDALLAAFDDDIKELHESGKIAEILEKYGMSPSAADTGEARLLK
ncbi:substrate-binding periplasmic protein [Phaeovulum sp.]|uniref:substrate-binding periplasmic protein n=1 Tax=Phaeovulum sp. TaxID=2934796 RepID=UPI0039E4A4C6